MRRICFLIGDISHSGGTERVTSLIASKLAEDTSKYEVSILCLWGNAKSFFPLHKEISTYALFANKPLGKIYFFNYILKIRNYIVKNKIDTLIVVDSISCMYTVPALIGLNVKHICWEHFNFNVNLGVKFRDIGRKWAAKYCDYVVTLTKRDKELWEQGLTDIRAKIFPIANPTPYETVDFLPSQEYKIILAIGRPAYIKGFDLLIEAWAKVCQQNDNWLLRIVGSGEDELALKQQVKQYGIEHRVEFIPATQNITQYYKEASFFCLSSRFEGLPMVLLEAQSYGLPVIAFDCDTGPSDLIDHGKNGWLVENGNVDALANTLQMAMDITQNKYIELVKQGKRDSRRFQLEEIMAVWSEII